MRLAFNGEICIPTKIKIKPLANGNYGFVRSCLMIQVLFLCIMRILPIDALKYILDVINIYLVAKLVTCYPFFDHQKRRNLMLFLLPNVIYCAIGTFSFIASIPRYGANILLYVWSLRGYFRFAIFGSACIAFLHEKDYAKIFKIFDVVFFINLMLVLYQYFMLGKRADYLNGVFGTEIGGNTFSNMYMIIMTVYAFVKWMRNEKSFIYMVFICGGCLLIATLSELKVFYVELIGIYAMSFLITKKDIKKLMQNLFFIAIGIIVLQYMLKILYELYPDFQDFMSVESIIERSSKDKGYTGRGDINRLTAFSKINETIFEGTFLERFFGVGLGNATNFDAGFLSSRSKISVQYDYLHYSWFSHAFMYVECGFVGVLFYMLSFLIPIISGCIRIRQKDQNPFVVCGLIVSVICCALMLYNETLKVEAAYFAYFMISVIFNTESDIYYPQKKIISRIQKNS